MKIREIGHLDPIVLSLKGDPLGEPDAMILRKKVNDLISAGVRRVVLDLKGVLHINSAGVGGLVCAMISLRKAGGDLCLACINRHVQNILSITHLTEVFKTHETVDQATASFGQ